MEYLTKKRKKKKKKRKKKKEKAKKSEKKRKKAKKKKLGMALLCLRGRRTRKKPWGNQVKKRKVRRTTN